MNRRGQAIIFTLLFLIPMIVAFGLMMRVDGTINLKIRLQDAVDAAAQEGGAQVARTMNQVAVNNMAILKYHALVAATNTAKLAANVAKLKAMQELTEATNELTCWTQALEKHTRECSFPFQFRGCDKIQPAQDCVNCLNEQIQMWQKIVSFWNDEEKFFSDQLNSFQSELGPMCKDLGDKSDRLVTQLKNQLDDLYTRIGREHRIHVNTTENRQWLTSSRDGRPMEDGGFNVDKIFKKGQLRDYAAIAMTATEQGRQDTDRGLFNFEGPPTKDFSGNRAKAKSGGQPVNPPWGPTTYYMEYIYSVHIGLPGFFAFQKMHGPLGNPDTQNPTCGGGQHKGCENDAARVAQIECNQGKKPCHRDQKEYTADTFHNAASNMLQSQNDQEFNKNEHTIYLLADDPKLEFLVTGRIEADQGFWNRLFKARTVDQPDTGARDASANYLRALAKYELYNLTETNGTILSRGQYNQYAKAMLSQDWNALMTPIVKDEIPNERPVIRNNMVH